MEPRTTNSVFITALITVLPTMTGPEKECQKEKLHLDVLNCCAGNFFFSKLHCGILKHLAAFQRQRVTTDSGSHVIRGGTLATQALVSFSLLVSFYDY